MLCVVRRTHQAWGMVAVPEVGIGPDAEIFTKAPVLSAVGLGADIGIHPKSVWNNLEPEVVLAVNSRGRWWVPRFGNDVNLRDFEGRSALLLGKAKDNNASCAIGPFIRLCDEHFGINDIRQTELALRVEGAGDGFVMTGSSSLNKISDPLELVGHAGQDAPVSRRLHAVSRHHVRPDAGSSRTGLGFPRGWRCGVNFIRKVGKFVNRVGHSDQIAPWTFGIAGADGQSCGAGLLKVLP